MGRKLTDCEKECKRAASSAASPGESLFPLSRLLASMAQGTLEQYPTPGLFGVKVKGDSTLQGVDAITSYPRV
jgi:hypothetical protein